MADGARTTLEGGTMAVRKKFATPPVKIACLACRASRTRCSGEKPCASCTSKDRVCVYKPSRRGGPRTRKKPRLIEEAQEAVAIDPEAITTMPADLLVENYINPGAGLKNLTEVLQDSDMLFDTLFNNTEGFIPSVSPPAADAGPAARSYSSDFAILNAYYIWIHPYFPILPPPESPLFPDEVSALYQSAPMDVNESSSPVALALSALLALIPCPQDASPLVEESVLFRRKYAQFLAQAAFESIEVESERPESSIEPSKALEDSDDEIARYQFHPKVPIQLESIIALDILSVYEYAQRGNLKRMRTRAGAALMSAMDLSLHIDRTDDEFSEARRRVWWMTYVCVCQGSIVSNTKPTFDIFAPTITTKFPTLDVDPEAWPVFVKSQQAILTSTSFVIDLNEAMRTQQDMTKVYQKMIDLELTLEPLLQATESWNLDGSLTDPVDQREAVVAQALRGMAIIKLNSARIKVHRYCAFFDLPVFPRKNCDLKPTQEKELRHWPSCCSTLVGGHSGPSSHSAASSSPTLSLSSTPTSDSGHTHQVIPSLVFPYSSHQSGKICLKSALNIARAFDALPYPNTTIQPCVPPPSIGPFSDIITPRTMPSFACCAMQCAYVLLMVYEKTQSLYPGWNTDSGSLAANNLLGRLQQGLLSILATLENYGTAFEALSGMRDQIRDKRITISSNPKLPVCHFKQRDIGYATMNIFDGAVATMGSLKI
ncbi:hypothetical protein BX600DRAFT_491737 [Xylariales sp. PMI_506]|nr:hypothetical protein BX600DRAFT_491737 [Xylariales sp. PMI_506]